MVQYNQEKPEDLLEVDYQVVEDHLASLRYAGLIQHALMPDPYILKGVLRDFFILFLPRDIVSGDFYYTLSNRQFTCIAAGDCTGHGVPGALLSILGISFLNEILQSKVTIKANRVLNIMREKIMKALNQTGERAETKDSIDIGICIIENGSRALQYAGANRPLIRIRDGELVEFRPDKMTIGIGALAEQPFTNSIIDTKSGDSFYLFSDGFADQFGGATDKKFKYKQFKQTLLSVTGLSMASQRECLEYTFKEWKGRSQQNDDVLVFGFQV
ncbi:MAG: SpoIIE family protein phosphatase [Bacteroidota bacterium]|nr:SpoIIE family protein phosphatase [Bacteroidota bacterium]